jgi:hypothetical protein
MPPRKKNADGKPELTTKERRLVEHAARGESLTEAAKKAGYSPASAATAGKKGIRKYPVAAALSERIQGLKAETDEIHAVLSLHLRGDIGDFETCFNDEGNFDLKRAKALGLSRLVKKLRRRTRHIPAGDGEYERQVEVEIELYSSQQAAATLAKILGIEQTPRENDADVKRREYERTIDRIIERVRLEAGVEWTRAQAVERLIERDPEARKYLTDED